MRAIYLYSGILFLTLVLFGGCTRDTTPVEFTNTNPDDNIIGNPSFELDGIASTEFWNVTDTSLFNLDKDAPVGGGAWSLAVRPIPFGPIPDSPSYLIPLYPEPYVFQLTFYAKYQNIPGSIIILLKNGSRKLTTASLRVDSNSWQKYSLVDSLYAEDGDSLMILLFGGRTDAKNGSTNFDQVILKQLP